MESALIGVYLQISQLFFKKMDSLKCFNLPAFQLCNLVVALVEDFLHALEFWQNLIEIHLFRSKIIFLFVL